MERKLPEDGHHSETRVFVGSIPASATKPSLLNYFSHFGHVIRVEMQVKPTENSSDRLNPGWCHIIVADKATADLICNIPFHNFEGRLISCKPYVKGGSLKRSNLENNKRRVIVKNVPWNSTEEEIRQIARNYGDIEAAFFFQKGGSSNESLQYYANKQYKQPRTASIQFREFEAADRFIKTKAITIRGARAKIEPYDHKHKQKSNPDIGQASSTVIKSGMVQMYSELSRTSLSVGEKPPPPLLLPVREKAFKHSFKPTNKVYHLQALQNAIDLASPPPISTLQAGEANIRLNISKIRQPSQRVQPSVRRLGNGCRY